MNIGKTLFTQLMDFLPWKTFHRIVDRYSGDYRSAASVRRAVSRHGLCATDLPQSLRDIEVCLAAQAGKLYHMGIGAAVARSTLADANKSRDWRIDFEFAQRLIIKARALYVDEDFGVEWLIPSMPSMPRPSICACRCFRGRRFAPPRRP